MTLVPDQTLQPWAEAHREEELPTDEAIAVEAAGDRTNPYRGIRRFFIFCSGAEPHLLWEAESEQTTYATIGGTVLATGVLATISVTVALAMAFEVAWYTALPIGVVWGAVIFNLDRWLVASFRKLSSWWQTLLSVLPRVALAVLFGLIISEPLILRIFDREIQEQIVDTNATTLQERLDDLDTGDRAQQITVRQELIEAHRVLVGAARQERATLTPAETSDELINTLQNERAGLETRSDELTRQVSDAEARFEVAQSALIEEVAQGCADAPSGGVCRPGDGRIAQQKREDRDAAQAARDVVVAAAAAERATIDRRVEELNVRIRDRQDATIGQVDDNFEEYEEQRDRLTDQISGLEEEIDTWTVEIDDLEEQIGVAKAQVRASDIETGIVARMRAFEDVKEQSSEVALFHLLLRSLFVAIDVVPIVGKWLYSLGRPKPYDQRRDEADREVVTNIARREDARRIALEGSADTERHRVGAVQANQQFLINYASEIQRNIGSAMLAGWEAENLPPGFQRVDPDEVPQGCRIAFGPANFDHLDRTESPAETEDAPTDPAQTRSLDHDESTVAADENGQDQSNDPPSQSRVSDTDPPNDVGEVSFGTRNHSPAFSGWGNDEPVANEQSEAEIHEQSSEHVRTIFDGQEPQL